MSLNYKLSVITLNYKNADLTAKCINSVIESIKNTTLNLELIVIDNSAEETAHQLRNVLPDTVKIIETEKNLGFAKANNIGIKKSTGEFILLINNDVFVNKESIETGIKYLEENTNTAIWAPQIIGTNDKVQTSCAKFPSLKGVIGEYLFGRQWDWYKNSEQWNTPQKVDTLVGAFILIKKNILEKIGLLNEDYFFTMEDMEYCSRIHQNKMDVVYDPRCSVVHLGSASQTHKWMNDPHLHKNRVLYFRKKNGWLRSIIVSFIIKIGLLLRKIKSK